MTRQPPSRNRAASRWTRVLSAVTVSVFSTASIAWLGAGARTVHPRTVSSAPATFTRLENIPSHNDRFRASLVPSSAPRVGQPTDWSLIIATADGTPVSGAAISLDSWMPDDEASGTRTYTTREIGRGRYRVNGLRVDRAGWWNVRLGVTAQGVADSLAFNLVF